MKSKFMFALAVAFSTARAAQAIYCQDVLQIYRNAGYNCVHTSRDAEFSCFGPQAPHGFYLHFDSNGDCHGGRAPTEDTEIDWIDDSP